ncbi:ribonuclease T [Pleionea litopenaei]|uniref:Ribonuclease T n=1 Tax=Pleionea litopenaei TaxID=3070815 RepID=A0AA51X8Q2_9GAMM|nr:ribonuclease T [Pleionea sp. HL-JVS1]WMS88330.1 ribonuclease T [Pleionea sp. HL-JVS1]
MLEKRFRGFFPVVVDVETGGFNHQTDALLEVAAITLKFDEDDNLVIDQKFHEHVEPFEDANLEPAALEVTGIDPFNPLRGAIEESKVIKELFKFVRHQQKSAHCQRSILVGHNPTFDLGFIKAATERNNIKRNPFHPFSTFDTATLAALCLGQTVLAKACQTAEIEFDNQQAHSALYDTEKTAQLFCQMVNRFKTLGGWPLASKEEPKELSKDNQA